MTQREYLLLLWPLALAAGAWQSRREHRANVAELFASTARPLAERAVPRLGALGIAVVCAYVTMAAVAAPSIMDTASYLPLASFAVVAVGALALVAATWLGLGIGRVIPSPLTAPVLAVAGIGLLLVLPFAVGSSEWLAMLLSPVDGMSQFTDFQTVPGRVSAAQGIWLTALAGSGVVLLAARSRRTQAAALLPAVLGALLGALVIPRGADFVPIPIDPVAQEMVCADGTPRVCISRTHGGLLAEVTPIARRALAVLATLPEAPTTAQEDTWFSAEKEPPPPSVDTVLFPVQVDVHGHLAHPGNALPQMLDAAGVDMSSCTDSYDIRAARAAAYWLMGRQPVAEPGEPAELNAEAVTLWRGLQVLPEAEARARVAAVREAALACEDIQGLLSRSSE
ncbi:conserved membrane protein of unknown function [Modestobacter italicus]|uniref:Uncharacterized protein n=2 Tax=Modestobacter italicus (strain DSM 44449 / CECT 9708 / BC 501) TaxID=2732864 RepID=I4F0T8_MODI5|nr:conserved membrane protein of unknown function [Modestobacter marinus]